MTADRRQKPNIVFVITDQMRSTALGCAGVERVLTPHLDRFAAQSTRFTNAVSNTPACTPARASLLTGKHVLSHRLVNNDMQLGAEHRTLADCLNAGGYRCGYIGKWHLDGVNRAAFIPPGPRRQGFDDFWAGTECNHRYLQGYYYAQDRPEPIWFDDYEPAGQTDLALGYIRQRAGGDQPFCLFVSWAPPHCPYNQVPQNYRDMYPPNQIEFLPNAVGAHIQAPGTKGSLAQAADLTREQHDAAKRQIIADYYAQVTALDDCFGRLTGCLETEGLANDTIVVFTSDHGDMLFSQDRGWKGKPWRESVGIPLLMRWPDRIPAGRVAAGPIGLVDLMPTLLGLAGLDAPAEAEGLDLSAFVCGDDQAAPASEYINYPCSPEFFRDPAWRGVVTERHTYVASRDGPWLLYDDAADPFQQHNLVDRPEARTLVGELDAVLRDWLTRTGDAFLPAGEIANRYSPGHRDNVLPNPPLEPVIRQGQEERRADMARAGS